MTTLAAIALGVAVAVVWLGMIVWAVKGVWRDTETSDVARVLWLALVVVFPVFGPIAWAFVRWQFPGYGRLRFR